MKCFVQVLTTGLWPTQPGTTCNLPVEIMGVCEKFQTFYLGTHTRRKLSWQTNRGTTNLKETFWKGQKHELNVSTYQMCVLMLFKNADQLSYNKIEQATEIPSFDLKRCLQSLLYVNGKNILRKEPMSKDIGEDDAFFFNDKFSRKFYKNLQSVLGEAMSIPGHVIRLPVLEKFFRTIKDGGIGDKIPRHDMFITYPRIDMASPGTLRGFRNRTRSRFCDTLMPMASKDPSSFPWSLCVSVIKDMETLVEVAAVQMFGEDKKWDLIAITEAVKVLVQVDFLWDSGYKMVLQGGETTNVDEDPTASNPQRRMGGVIGVPRLGKQHAPGNLQDHYGCNVHKLEGRALSALNSIGENRRMVSDLMDELTPTPKCPKIGASNFSGQETYTFQNFL